MENNRHPTFANGKICYIVIPALDVDHSAAFYEAVFGWNIRKRNDGTVAFDDGVGEVSGTWAIGRKPATEGELLVYIMVNDIQATIQLVEAKGGMIVQPVGKDYPEITATFTDPAGNIMGLYQQPA